MTTFKKLSLAATVAVALIGIRLTAQTASETSPSNIFGNYQTKFNTGTNSGFWQCLAQSATNFAAGQVIDLTQEKGGVFGFTFYEDATATDVIKVVLYPSMDGTTNGMDTTKSLVMQAAGTTGGARVCVTTNLAGTIFSDYNYWIPSYMTNAAATANVTNAVFWVRIGRNKR